MTKKSLNKLLSVVLTLAICFTTVFGCLITANAESDGCHEWSKGKVDDDKTSATINLTFTAPTKDGIGVITFDFAEVKPKAANHLVFDEKGTKVLTGTPIDDGAAYDDGDISVTVEAGSPNTAVVDASNAYDSITLQLAFTLSGETTSDEDVFKVEATNIVMADPFGAVVHNHTSSSDAGLIKVGCTHVVAVTGDPIKVDTVNGYSVYESSVCTNCDKTFGRQIVPTAEALPDNPADVVDTIYWDRNAVATRFASGSGKQDDPYIIKSAAELAYLVGLNGEATKGKHYKIADGITNIVLQRKAYADKIVTLSSAADVKEYFESGIFVNEWVINGNEMAAFCGTFDGNGATIYGLYTVSRLNAGLFATVDAGATIKNIAIKNSYFKTTENNYHMGAIAAFASGSDENTAGVKNNGMIWINNCTVANCYMRSVSTSTQKSGIVFGNAPSDVISIDNCLVYGNDGYYGATHENKMPLIADASNSVAEEGAIIPDGLDTLIKNDYLNNVVRDSIILDCDVMNTANKYAFRKNHKDCYSNVYTNGKSGTVAFSDVSHTYLEDNIKAIAAADVQGNVDQTKIALVWGAEWVCGAEGQYPAQAIFAAAVKAQAISTPEYELYGSSVTYNNDGSFDINLHFIPPYEGFAPELYVGNTDGTKFFKLTATESSYRTELGDNALMYTISKLSARDIETVWLPTLVAKVGSVTKWGMSQQIAIRDNANAVLEGDYDVADKRVAAAVIGYGKASEAALSATTNPNDELNVVYIDSNKPDSTFMSGSSGSGSATDPYIISSYGHWRHLAEQATFEETNGKYFKVDDTIDMFVFQKKSYIESVAGSLDKFLSLNANGVKKALSKDTNNRTQHNNRNKNDKNSIFAGTIDGNGVKIVGSYSNYSGLFYNVAEGATFKNIELSHNYSDSTSNNATASGNLIATIVSNSASETNIGTVALENIIVHNNYQTPKGDYLPQSGVLVGTVVDKFVRLEYRNILTYDNITLAQKSATDTTMMDCALVGQFNNGWKGEDYSTTNGSYSDSIFLDCVPYPISVQANHGTKSAYWSNVYTTKLTESTPSSIPSESEWSKYDITQLESVDSAKGSAAITNMPNLDWNNTWVVTEGYPAFISDDYSAQGKTVYWSGTYGNENSIDKVNDTNAAGTSWDEAIIIDNAEELYYVIRNAGVNNTVGKFFKVADDIGRFVLQPKGVLDLEKLLACEDGAAVKNYFETLDDATLVEWAAATAVFDGNFDGNGAEIIGLYDVSSNHAGFIGYWDGGVLGDGTTVDSTGITVKNTVVKNAYLKSSENLGVFGSKAASADFGAKVSGTLNLESCAVINCYMKQTQYAYSNGDKYAESGVVTGDCVEEVVKINNMLVYGNDATDKDGNTLWLRGSIINNRKIWKNGVATSALDYNSVKNSIVLDADPFDAGTLLFRKTDPSSFSYLYTNHTPPTNKEYSDIQTKQISADDVKGANAQTIVNTLNTSNGSTVWYAGAIDDMPSFKDVVNMPWSIQSIYDVIELDTYDDYADSTNQFGVYATALSLKANPYMTFAFAFDKEYKINRDKIKVKFTYTVNGTEYTTVHIAVPAYVEGEELKNVNGWTNVANSGRYHTYKATGIPVEALANSITVKASYNGGEYVNFGAFGVEGLVLDFENANKVTPCDYYAKRIEAARAFLFYVKMVNARYGSVQ